MLKCPVVFSIILQEAITHTHKYISVDSINTHSKKQHYLRCENNNQENKREATLDHVFKTDMRKSANPSVKTVVNPLTSDF
jgi:hypothetical protein